MTNNYCFVIDYEGSKLSPTKVNKAWYLIRKGRATLESKYPMVIRLNKVVNITEPDMFYAGIDDGTKHVGISIIQKCDTTNKVVFKGTIELRKDVSRKMSVRRGYRQYRRKHKRHRPSRFSNRKREGFLAPSHKQRKQSIVRVVRELNKYLNISDIFLEDVKVDTNSIVEGRQLYGKEYTEGFKQKKKTTTYVRDRDNKSCKLCGNSSSRLEVHHIVPKRLNGSNRYTNLVTLCQSCHKKVTGVEELYIEELGGDTNFNILKEASAVMMGKKYLQYELNKVAPIHSTNSRETYELRKKYNIPKSHSNDAFTLINVFPLKDKYIDEFILKPIRRSNRRKQYSSVMGIKHRDLVEYTFTNGKTYRGYVTGLSPNKGKHGGINFTSPDKICKGVNASKVRLLWSFTNIYWFTKEEN